MKNNFRENLLSAEKMCKKITELKREGKKVVFTNGVFDIFGGS